jgi:hypothetical protein
MKYCTHCRQTAPDDEWRVYARFVPEALEGSQAKVMVYRHRLCRSLAYRLVIRDDNREHPADREACPLVASEELSKGALGRC